MADSRLVAMRPVLMVPPNTGASGFLDVALRQGAGVEVANQNDPLDLRRQRRRPMRRGYGWVGTPANPSRVGSVTVPFVDSLRSAEGNESSEGSGRSSATGSPRSVTINVRPSRTR